MMLEDEIVVCNDSREEVEESLEKYAQERGMNVSRN